MLRYQFLQSVLLGGTDDRLVLADLLEEQGDAELASWCREQKEGIDERVEFVLALLPYQITLRLGCEFVAGRAELAPQVVQVRLGLILAMVLELLEMFPRHPKTEARVVEPPSLAAAGDADQTLWEEPLPLQHAMRRSLTRSTSS